MSLDLLYSYVIFQLWLVLWSFASLFWK